MLDVPRELIVYLAGLLSVERRRRGTRHGTRALTPFRHALFVLAWFRDGADVERLGAGFGLSRATAYRYRNEGISVLAAQAPDLVEVMAAAVADGLPFLILDGKLVAIDRLDEKKTNSYGNVIHAWYSGKSRDFRANMQALMRPDGIPLWTSPVIPGSFHDITAARAHVLVDIQPFLTDLPILADAGYIGAGAGVLVPVLQPPGAPELSEDIRTYNRVLRGLRFQGERGFALMTSRWKALRHVTMSPRAITDLARCVLVLIQFEHKMIKQ
jgi:hypothetical protein